VTIDEYTGKVIDLFKSGRATEEHYREMAEAVLRASEDQGAVPEIDRTIDLIEELQRENKEMRELLTRIADDYIGFVLDPEITDDVEKILGKEGAINGY